MKLQNHFPYTATSFSQNSSSNIQNTNIPAASEKNDNVENNPSGKSKNSIKVATTIKSAASLEKVLHKFSQEKSSEERKVAIISGGSLCGMATALQLKNLGFNVIVAEKRVEYTRQNVLALREEALYSLANLSTDGKLLKYLTEKNMISICDKRIDKEKDSYQKKSYPASRFMGWMVPHPDMKPMIPDRSGNDRQAEYLNIEKNTLKKKTQYSI